MTTLPRHRRVTTLMGPLADRIGQPLFEVSADHPDRPRRVTYAVFRDGTVLRSPGTGAPRFEPHGRTRAASEIGLIAYAIKDGATPRCVFYTEEDS